jgi:glycosyltransferase involved in cell wall biosynthesis
MSETVHALAGDEVAVSSAPEVSIVMPCLNESLTLATCIEKAHKAMREIGVSYEVVIGDNGSTDGSQEIAREHGARVVPVPKKGYGHAYQGAIAEARGRVIVIGDSDDSYDFLTVRPFVEKIDEGYDFVMGNRFKGGIAPGAMPKLHRYVGNPILTSILNLFFGAGIGDAHCGMRAFTKAAYERMGLKTGGMEYASEMIIRAAQENLRIAEIPTTLKKDGRDRPPHLRSFHDGWRHLRFMLMFSPMWLFLLPGVLCAGLGGALVVMLPFVPITIYGHALSFHFSILGSLMTILGVTIVQLAAFAKIVMAGKGIGRNRFGGWIFRSFRLEYSLVAGLASTILGAAVNVAVFYYWARSDFGTLSADTTNLVMLASTMIIVGVQFLFTSFFLGILRASFTDVWVD